MHELFRRFSARASEIVGNPWSFILALIIIVIWGVTGPLFSFSDTWQLIINTGTTIVTFLMVFLIQNTQNRDARSIQLKLDELLRVTAGAATSIIDLDRLSDRQLAALERHYKRICAMDDDDIDALLDDRSGRAAREVTP